MEDESKGVASVVVGVLDCFWEFRRCVRVERVAWEERIVEAWILRCPLSEETVLVRGVVERGTGCLL